MLNYNLLNHYTETTDKSHLAHTARIPPPPPSMLRSQRFFHSRSLKETHSTLIVNTDENSYTFNIEGKRRKERRGRENVYD